MGSYDRMPEGYDGPAPEHVITCNSRWSHRAEKHSHPSAELVKVCYLAAADERKGIEVWPCSWLLEGRYDDNTPFSYPCNLPTRYTPERGEGCYECAGGHDHVPPELRYAEGWDYTDDPEEALGLMKNGTVPVQMSGQAWF